MQNESKFTIFLLVLGQIVKETGIGEAVEGIVGDGKCSWVYNLI